MRAINSSKTVDQRDRYRAFSSDGPPSDVYVSGQKEFSREQFPDKGSLVNHRQ